MTKRKVNILSVSVCHLSVCLSSVCLSAGAEARPGVTVAELRNSFLSAHQGVARGAVQRPLIVRIINKSHLMYYGRSERNCSCPYKVMLTAAPCGTPAPCVTAVSVQAVLEVCDRTGSVCVVLWNSVCVQWYRRLKPGDIIRLRGFRVKRHFQAEPEDVGTKLMLLTSHESC